MTTTRTATSVLLLLLVVSLAQATLAQENAKANATEPTDKVLTKEECKSEAPIDEFATDNQIISCVRNASADCCEAMDRLLGEQSPVHYCTCSSGVLEEVLSQAVPIFAKEIIHTRIEECGLPVAGDDKCAGLYDDSDVGKAASVADGPCNDTYPPDVDTQYTCEDQANFGKCGESWMQGFCQLSCEKCDPAATSNDEEEETSVEGGEVEDEEVLMAVNGDVLANGTEVLANCTDEKSPKDNSGHDCPKQKDFGKCSEGWMEGYCLLSCGKCIKPVTREAKAASAVLNSETNNTSPDGNGSGDEILENGASGNATETALAESQDQCKDEYPPNVDTQYTCEDQASFGKCDESWMEGFCLLSCEKCEEELKANAISQ